MDEGPEPYSEARESINRAVNDSISKLLLSNSHLTLPQLEAILADAISSEKASRKGQRRLFRSSRRTVSRGSYNRTLIQAQNNVIRSIYTILLLGYLGLFDAPTLQPFLELSDNLHGYVEELKASRANRTVRAPLEARLWETVSALARRQSFKDSL